MALPAARPEPAGTLHDARKTWCTLTAAVVPMHVLQKWAGHAKIETTATYYTRVRESDADRLRDAMRIESLPVSLRRQDRNGSPRDRTRSPRVPLARIGGRLTETLEAADAS